MTSLGHSLSRGPWPTLPSRTPFSLQIAPLNGGYCCYLHLSQEVPQMWDSCGIDCLRAWPQHALFRGIMGTGGRGISRLAPPGSPAAEGVREWGDATAGKGEPSQGMSCPRSHDSRQPQPRWSVFFRNLESLRGGVPVSAPGVHTDHCGWRAQAVPGWGGLRSRCLGKGYACSFLEHSRGPWLPCYVCAVRARTPDVCG